MLAELPDGPPLWVWPRLAFGEPLGGTGGGTFALTIFDFCFNGGNVNGILRIFEGAVVTTGFDVVIAVTVGAADDVGVPYFLFILKQYLMSMQLLLN